jgi:hypothetical protein
VLDHDTSFQYEDVVGKNPSHGEIVCHKHTRELEILLKLQNEVDDLSLDRDIERRRRLVADEQPGVCGERAGDHNPLLLSTAERSWALACALWVEADLSQELGDPAAALVGGLPPERRSQACPDRQEGVERLARILEHHLDR